MCLFGKKYIGLDVADGSVEVAMLKDGFSKGKVVSLGRVELEVGIVEKGRIKNSEKLALAIKELMSKAKPRAIKAKEIYFGLPESQTFVHHFYLPTQNKKDRQSFIDNELSENIPIERKNLVYSSRILSETKEKMEILVVAARREVILEWSQFFKGIKMEIKNFDTEILATYRGLFVDFPKKPTMVVDIGAATTFVGIFAEQGLCYEYVINIAGNNFTQAVAVSADMDFAKAEVEKIKVGLKGRTKKNTVALETELSKIAEEIKQSIGEYKTETSKDISGIVLVGGSSMLPGLSEYFSAALGLPVQIGKAKAVNEKTPLFYIEAIGLALRGIEKKWDRTDPNIPRI